MIQFDDRDLILSGRAYHIESVTLFTSKLVYAMQITYLVDGEYRTVKHNLVSLMKNETKPEKVMTIELDEFEHIECLECTYS